MRAESSLNTQQQCAYALPALGIHFLIGPIGLLQGIYTTYFGVTLSAMAVVLITVRLFDAVTDPLIGYLSDRQLARSGSRQGFIIAGGVLFILSSYFLYVPVDPESVNASTQVSITYLLVCFFAFYLSYTLFNIPHLAWASELAVTPAEKNSIFSWRVVMVVMGGLFFYLIPFLPFFETPEFTPQVLKIATLSSALLILPSLFFCIKKTPKKHTVIVQADTTTRLRLPQLIGNKPLLLFLTSFLFYSSLFGVFWGISFIFVNSYLGLGEHYSIVVAANTLALLLFIKVWNLVAIKVSRKTVWSLGVGLFILGALLMAFVRPGADYLPLLLASYIIVGSGLVAGEIVAPAILSDVVDYHQWKFKADCRASIYSLYMLLVKISHAVGAALAFAVAGWYGFDPSMTEFSAEAVFGLRLAVIWIPVFLGFIAILFILQLPITVHRHTIIQRRLDDRTRRTDRNLIEREAPPSNAQSHNPSTYFQETQ